MHKILVKNNFKKFNFEEVRDDWRNLIIFKSNKICFTKVQMCLKFKEKFWSKFQLSLKEIKF